MSRWPRGLRRLVERPDVTIGHEFRPPPYGGSNQFLLALRRELERRGLRVGANIAGRHTRGAVLNAHVFDADEMRWARSRGCRLVHRVDGPLQLYRGYDDGVDGHILRLNRELAHRTVVQSRYSLDAHARLGFDFVDPVVIPNAVDASIFHPPPAPRSLAGRRVRIISTSWSDNPNKGADTVAWLAGRLDAERFEATFVGRSPVDLPGVTALAPRGSLGIAELLRAHDIYLAPGLHEAASNALLEALACGLPALYARSGGHAEIVGGAGLGYDDRAELPELVEQLVAEYDDRRDRISIPPLADVTDRYLEAMGLS
jgi:glycosyltransferase involved in cell wall biosynthesis